MYQHLACNRQPDTLAEFVATWRKAQDLAEEVSRLDAQITERISRFIDPRVAVAANDAVRRRSCFDQPEPAAPLAINAICEVLHDVADLSEEAAEAIASALLVGRVPHMKHVEGANL